MTPITRHPDVPEKAFKAFLPVLEWLENGGKHRRLKFSMNDFFKQEGGCGTACCIAGAVDQFNFGGQVADDLGGNAIESCYEVGERLSLPTCIVDQLFFARNSDLENAGVNLFMMDLKDITPEMGANTLRRYLETGEVEWDE